MLQTAERGMSIGAVPSAEGVSFRVWAPRNGSVDVVFHNQPHAKPAALTPEVDRTGYFSGLARDARAGMCYSLCLDASQRLLPDPASRFQPSGPAGPSLIVDPASYTWHDEGWKGLKRRGHVIYEMHVGTFTQEGTWAAASAQLPELASLGVTVLEIMPISEFPGQFGWGYDVANQFAPYRRYGSCDEARRFVDLAHQLGLGVILDVVYNHFGRLGEELLRPFSESYFSRRYQNDWGCAINFDGDQCSGVREFFLANVRHWIHEYHFDGLRVDATQAFHDGSSPHILLQIARTAQAAAAGRSVLMVGESEPQRAELFRSAAVGGCEFDALWNDDFHHSARVRLTGRREAYYTDYQGSADELLAAATYGYLFQGQRYAWQDKPRGQPALDIEPWRFINYLQNHDQIANSLHGKRLDALSSPGNLRAMTALLLLAPQTPLLFQGQEFAASSPFLYFNDSQGAEAVEVARGRAKFLAQFPSLATPEAQGSLIDPCGLPAFQRSKLDQDERAAHWQTYALHRDLLRLRRTDPVLSALDAHGVRGATLGADAMILRFSDDFGADRLLLLNFGHDVRRGSIAQPLVAPPEGRVWAVLWSSENPLYGGSGTPSVATAQGWYLPGESAVLLHAVKES